MRLTFDELPGAVPLAVIRGGRYNGHVVFIAMDDAPRAGAGSKSMPKEIDWGRFLPRLPARAKAAAIARLQQCYRTGREPEDDLAEIYRRGLASTKHVTRIDLDDGGQFQPICDPEKREVVYLFGPSGVGKSTAIANYAGEWRKLNPKSNVYLFSRLDEDESLDSIPGLKRVKIDDSLIDDPINVEDIPSGSLVVMDDINTIRNPKLLKSVQGTLHDILEVGRHRRIDCCISNHLGSDYARTRTILNEASGIFCFPGGSSNRQVEYTLTHYAGLDKKQVKDLLKLKSRWVFVRTRFPTAVVSSTTCYLPNAEED